MKKTYFAPEVLKVSFETEEILGISFTGNNSILIDSDNNNSSKNPSTDFGGIDLF